MMNRTAFSIYATVLGIGFASLAGAAEAAPAPATRVDVVTGNPVHVLKVGEEDKLALSLKNESDSRQRFSLDVTLTDVNHKAIPIPGRTFDLAPRETTSWKLPAPAELGIWWVHSTLTPAEPAGPPLSATHSFAYMKPAGPTQGPRTGFRFGMSGWFASGADGPRNALAIALCGVDICRFGGVWQPAQPSEGQWNWGRPDQIINQFKEQNIEPQLMLSYTPAWAALPVPEGIQKRIDSGDLLPIRSGIAKAPRLDAWRQFVAEAGKRYRGQVRYWEVWNEPDWRFFYGTTSHYLEMLKIAHEELKRIDPDNQVVTGGFAVAGDKPAKNRPNLDMQEAVIRDGQEFFDLHGHHEHGPFEKFVNAIDGIVVPLRKKYLKTPKPFYFTETGAAIKFGEKDGAGIVNSEQEQAAALVKKLVFAWSRGAAAYNWFCIVDMRDGDYGLFTAAFQPKAVYVAYNTMVWMLRGKEFLRQADLPEKRWAFLFADGKEQVVVAWDQYNATSRSDLIVKTDAKEAELVDLMGNRSPAPLADGRARIPAATMPRFVVLRGAATDTTVGAE